MARNVGCLVSINGSDEGLLNTTVDPNMSQCQADQEGVSYTYGFTSTRIHPTQPVCDAFAFIYVVAELSIILVDV